MLAAGLALTLLFERHVLQRVAQELDVRWHELARSFTLDADGAPF